LVSNAGIFNSTPFDELTPDDWRRICASISTVASSSRSRHTG
jgi:NAD(P)-dependent dehydrogenase (short-subunit alcohol dehydrogenase family)